MVKVLKLKNLFWFLVILLIAGKVILAESNNIIAPTQDETAEDFQEALDESNDPEYDFPAISISLSEATQLGLLNSLDIQIARLNAYIEGTSLQDVESIFDTFLNAEGSYEHDRLAQPSTIAGSDSHEKKFSAGLEKLLPTGTTVSIDLQNTKAKTDSTFVALNPYDEAEVGFSLTQEIGRNFFGLADRGAVKVTKIDIENADFTSLDDIEDAIFGVQEAYWRLVLRYKDVEITEDMLERAVKLYKLYQDRFSLGMAEETDVLAMEAMTKARQAEVAIAVLARETAKNQLLFLLNRGDFQQNIVCKDKLSLVAYQVDLYESLKKAIAYRRDYKRVVNDLKKNNIEIVVNKNALWPQIDLEATFVRNSLNSSRKQAWKNLSTDSHDEYIFKFTFEFPLENNEAKAQLKKVRLEKQRYLLDLKRTERFILQEINNKVNQINTYHSQVLLAESAVDINERKVAQQIKRISYGRSNSETLIDYERDLITSRLFLAQNLFNYRVALIEMELVQNTLLDKYWKDPL